MKELLRVSPHQPVETVTVRDDKAEAFLKSGLYKETDFTPSENVHKKEDVFFSDSMSEKEIKAKIEKYNIPVEYNISNDDKKDKLLELDKLGYDVNWK